MAFLRAVDPQLVEHLNKNKARARTAAGARACACARAVGLCVSFCLFAHTRPRVCMKHLALNQPTTHTQHTRSTHTTHATQVDAQFFAFRWITLLLTQEFAFPEALRIWDTLLSDPRGRADCLLRVCSALVLRARAPLLAGDFAANVKLLQRYPPCDVAEVLRDAEALPDIDAILGPRG